MPIPPDAEWDLGDDNLGRNTLKALTEAGITPAMADGMTREERAKVPGLGYPRLARLAARLERMRAEATVSARNTPAYRVHQLLIREPGILTIDEEADVRALLDEHAERGRQLAKLREQPSEPVPALAVDGVTVHTRATVYTVNCLPDDPIDGDLFAITVEFRGGHAWGKPRPLDQQWAVLMRDHWNLGHDGKWSLKPSSDDEGYDQWIADHRFDLETALKVAAEQAPKVVINGSTPADVLARRARS